MPQSITIGAFVFGAVLLLIAILHGGGFKIFGAEVSGQAGRVGRVVAGFLGFLLLCVGLNGAFEKANDKNNPSQDNTGAQKVRPSSQHPADEGTTKPTDSGSAAHNPSNQTLVAGGASQGESAGARPAGPTATGAGQQSGSEQTVDLSGVWRDAGGNVYQVAQQGNAVTVRMSGPIAMGAATGTVHGHQFEDNYDIRYANGLRAIGSCRSTVSPELNVVRGTCYDNLNGQTENVLFR